MVEAMPIEDQRQFITAGFRRYISEIMYYEEMIDPDAAYALSKILENIPDDVKDNFDCVKFYVGRYAPETESSGILTKGFTDLSFLASIKKEIVAQKLDVKESDLEELKIWDEDTIVMPDISQHPTDLEKTLLFRFTPHE